VLDADDSHISLLLIPYLTQKLDLAAPGRCRRMPELGLLLLLVGMLPAVSLATGELLVPGLCHPAVAQSGSRD
jgi:hypothetical protein